MKIGICKLCLEEKELCTESHIIPRFMYKFLMGDNNQLVYLDKVRPTFRYNSEYEGGILCKNCDNIVIGKLDTYAANYIQGPHAIEARERFEMQDGKQVLIRENDSTYNYDKFKLFLLSILWRSSISSRSFFKNVELPKEIEEDLRQRILSKTPGESDQYACYIYLPPVLEVAPGERGFHVAYMPTMTPAYVDGGGFRMAHFIITGVHYYFVISAPPNTIIKPAIERSRISFTFNTVEDQAKLIYQIMELMKGHRHQ